MRPPSAAYLHRMFSLDGRTALVTGGSSGIGYAMAEAIGLAGAAVVLVARREAGLAAAAARLRDQGVDAHTISADLGDEHAVRQVCERAGEFAGEIAILVNAAANNIRRPMGELTREDYDATVRLNLTAPYLLGAHFGPRMAARGWGRIVNVASQQAISAFGDSGVYGVSKAALAGLTRSQAEAWSAHGVCVNTVMPGFVLTPLTEPAQAVPGRVEAMAARTMTGRNGLPRDFAGVAVLLAGDAAAYMTGQSVYVDGGFSVH
ncbi:SDR family oxidoreductase [Sphaerisporangium sp. B11E5]|uniref:SDR family NAD(P)-dependent oxidoreductase n=1 Tax=Sphaerisporangium sp. B11E5 TaxID=3153563 RepID=UPI00325E5CF4